MKTANAKKIELTLSHAGWYTANVGVYGVVTVFRIRPGQWRALNGSSFPIHEGVSLAAVVDALACCI